MKAAVFLKEVKQEAMRVKWPSLKEVSLIALSVLVAAGLSGALFLLVDSLIYRFVKFVLGIGS